ncbi:alpha/beta hydrolase [Mesorhizobium sp. STM 4661]|uniref:alpha/beta hydrolase n=1 Tax=Mesorhizobium sp. STM 4661 TaxID=1297570 RepID=UPI0002BDED5F|nr:alpha/beta hydrolase [Mesorhizobium sp. STM 4661]CCV13950.1 Dienelactone hydrolase domain protein [Mesorhizobium sp. STM 4661]
MVGPDRTISRRDILIAAGATATVTAAPMHASGLTNDDRRTVVLNRVSFKNRDIDVAGNIYFPNGFDETRTYAALVLTTPGSSMKEQIGAIYAEKLAARGFVALAFDPSYQGESGGEPRDLEDPAARVEDIRCAVDYLMTLPFVGEERVGLLGICAGGGYAVNAAITEHRFKALGTVIANDIGQAFRRMLPDVRKTLEDVGKQRTAEARGGKPRRAPWIPDSLKEAEEAGITDPEVFEAVTFYRESPYRHPNSTNRLLFRSYGYLLEFDAFHLVPELLSQPLQVIVGAGAETLANMRPDKPCSIFRRPPKRTSSSSRAPAITICITSPNT